MNQRKKSWRSFCQIYRQKGKFTNTWMYNMTQLWFHMFFNLAKFYWSFQGSPPQIQLGLSAFPIDPKMDGSFHGKSHENAIKMDGSFHGWIVYSNFDSWMVDFHGKIPSRNGWFYGVPLWLRTPPMKLAPKISTHCKAATRENRRSPISRVHVRSWILSSKASSSSG